MTTTRRECEYDLRLAILARLGLLSRLALKVKVILQLQLHCRWSWTMTIKLMGATPTC